MNLRQSGSNPESEARKDGSNSFRNDKKPDRNRQSAGSAGRLSEEPAARCAAEADELKNRRQLSSVIHSMLVMGLAVSMAAMITGLVMDLTIHREFTAAVPPFNEIVRRVFSLRPSGLLAFGLLTLIATPILRVVGSFFTFLYERDFRFGGITFLVLLILFLSLVLGHGA